MGIPSRLSRFSSVTSVLFVGAACAAAVVACSSDDDASGTNTDTSTGVDSGAATNTADGSADAGLDSDIQIVSGDSSVQSYTVSVDVTGVAGTGLVLKNNAGDDLAVAADGTFTFATPIADGTDYAVTVGTQPTSPSQSCVVTNGSSKLAGANVTGISVVCTTNTYTVKVAVTGLVGTGLVLTNNATDVAPGEELTVDAAGTVGFATKIASGAAYDVAVKTQPSMNQSCTIATDTGKGTVGAADVTIAVSCHTYVCSETGEGGNLSVTCPDGQTIDSFEFLSYGTPGGTCGAYTVSDCNAAATVDVIQSCVDQATCTIGANNVAFGDPCSGTVKHLYVQAACK